MPACLQGGHIALKYLFQASVAPAACIALSTWLEPSFNKQVSRTGRIQLQMKVAHMLHTNYEAWHDGVLMSLITVCDRELQGSTDSPGTWHSRCIAAIAPSAEHSGPSKGERCSNHQHFDAGLARHCCFDSQLALVPLLCRIEAGGFQKLQWHAAQHMC